MGMKSIVLKEMWCLPAVMIDEVVWLCGKGSDSIKQHRLWSAAGGSDNSLFGIAGKNVMERDIRVFQMIPAA